MLESPYEGRREGQLVIPSPPHPVLPHFKKRCPRIQANWLQRLEECGNPIGSQPRINRSYVPGTEGHAEGAIAYCVMAIGWWLYDMPCVKRCLWIRSLNPLPWLSESRVPCMPPSVMRCISQSSLRGAEPPFTLQKEESY